MGVIYEIRNIVNNKRYVGSSVEPKHRKAQHFSLLRKGRHHSIILQNAFNKYNEANFFFAIIEDNIPQDYLIEREQYWLDKLQPEYNIAKFADASARGRKQTNTTKNKIRSALLGIPQSNERIKARARANCKSVSQIDLVTGDVVKVWESAKEAEACSGFCSRSISKVALGRNAQTGGYGWSFTNG